MIDYVIYESPDDRILNRATEYVKSGGLICFPTDTNWIVACDPYNKNAVEKLYKFKNEDSSKHFSILCADISTASEVAQISDFAFKMIKKVIPGHYTFIFSANKKIYRVLKASKTDKEIGIRFTPDNLAQKILENYGDILLSTNIPKSMLGLTEEDDVYGYLIEESLSHLIKTIIDPGEVRFAGKSTIINFATEDGMPEVIREGAGDLSFL